MAGPNFLGADQGFYNKAAGGAQAYEFKGGRFAKPLGPPQALMRNGNNGAQQAWRHRQSNTMHWFKGRLYWCSGASAAPNTTLGSLTIMRYVEATDDWELVYQHFIGSTASTDHFGTGLFVVEAGGSEWLVSFGRASAFGQTNVPIMAWSSDGDIWSLLDPGVNSGNALNNPLGEGIVHAGLVFGATAGTAGTHLRTAFDPVGGGLSTFAHPEPGINVQQGTFFKFDNRLFHFAGTWVNGNDGFLSEFTFGTWQRLEIGAGLSGAVIKISPAGTANNGHRPCAVVLDADTVLLFGAGDIGGGQGLRCYALTLSAGSGSNLVSTDATATYVPAALTPSTPNLGNPDEYGLFNIGKGDDGFWYMVIVTADSSAVGIYSLVKVAPGALIQDAGATGAVSTVAISVATMNQGDNRDSKGTLPLVKPYPLQTAQGATGMIQNFRMDGDPLIALHGVVGGTPPFIEGEAVTWTGGSGVVRSGGVGVAELHLHTIAGVVPDGLLMTGAGGATATCSTSSGNGQSHTARILYYKEPNGTGLGAPDAVVLGGVGTLVAGSGVNCTVSKGTGPGGTDEVVSDADGSGTVKSFEWDFLLDGISANEANNVKLQATRV